ncbi:MAG: NAD(P)-dependent oxidoreductase [Clostridiales bacterium]|jgi:nucleoside-diphosphate-sugar epimerase|nr:NAD(P)-dependent oxidoreductase [Clostridiales bacterium]
MNYIVFGGSGFIGYHLLKLIREDCIGSNDEIYAPDISMPESATDRIEGVKYVYCDVRNPISLKGFVPTPQDIIFNFAAIHRTPGHTDHEYFETNILGADNVTAFAQSCGIESILFTSSIAPYGAGEDLKLEDSLPTPNTPYGISKLVAEKIHAAWQTADKSRRLTILRPGVVFGKGERGNFTRMYQGIKGRYFFYAGRRDTVKACVYVKDLTGFMKYLMIDNDFPGVGLFNCTYQPAPTVDEICEAIKRVTGLERRTLTIPALALKAAAVCAAPFGGEKLGLHPDRVGKLMASTNVSGKRLEECEYRMRYTLEDALSDWLMDCGGRCLE